MAYQITAPSQYEFAEQLGFMADDVLCLEKLLGEARLMEAALRKWTTTGVLSFREVQSVKSYRDAALILEAATRPLGTTVSQVARLASQIRTNLAGNLASIAEAVECGECTAESIAE